MNTTVVICILAFWAVLATCFMVAALRSRAETQRRLTNVRKDRDKALDIAEGFKREVNRLQPIAFPARDGSDGLSIARTLRKITGPVKPSSARTSSTSRSSSDSTDSFAAGVLASTLWVGSSDSGSSSSCDTSSSSSYSDSGSSSSDGGSCGGGE